MMKIPALTAAQSLLPSCGIFPREMKPVISLTAEERLMIMADAGTAEKDAEEADKWKIDKGGAKFAVLNKAVQEKYDCFQDQIREDKHPKTAAETCDCDDYKKLSRGLWSCRLSGGDRCYFTIDDKKKIVKIIAVGGHKLS